jgi:hypothetical protein
MFPKIVTASLVTTVLALPFIPGMMYGDDVPHPSVHIQVFYDHQPLPDKKFYGRMLERSDSVITGSHQESSGDSIIDKSLAIIMYDSVHACFWQPASMAFGGLGENSELFFDFYPPSEFKLAIFLPSLKRVLVSNEVERVHYWSKYRLDISTNGAAIITDITPFFNAHRIITFILALIITIALELLVALIYCSRRKIPKKKILQSVLFANLISLPIVWFVFPFLKTILVVILLSEIFAIVIEAYLIHSFNKTILSLRESFTLSLIMNVVSFLLGGFIFVILTVIFIGL